MNRSDILPVLQKIGEEKLLPIFEKLKPLQQKELFNEILRLDVQALLKQKSLSQGQESTNVLKFKPLDDVLFEGNQTFQAAGKKLIDEGKVGCLVVAGGQGTRLGFTHPKGMYPVTAVKKKSLFQLLAEKVKAASQQSARNLPLAIMTSPLNDLETQGFFKAHELFGLHQDQLFFFTQSALPALDKQGYLLFKSPSELMTVPDGNGSALHAFYQSGLWQKWQDLGIEYLLFLLIDNPLADPFDAELVGVTSSQKKDIGIKGIKRKNSEEKLGILVQDANTHKINVVEYSEFPKNDYEAKKEEELLFPYANISLFCISLKFIESIQQMSLPLHLAFKAISHYCFKSETYIEPKEPNAFKFERFIFDILPFGNATCLIADRNFCYSPLKNKSGPASLLTVQEDLIRCDIHTLESITKTKAPNTRPFEIDPKFYYPTDDLKKRWLGQEIPEKEYIS